MTDSILIALKLYVLALVLPFIGLGLWLTLSRKTPLEARWAVMLMTVSLVLTLLVEVIVLKGDVATNEYGFQILFAGVGDVRRGMCDRFRIDDRVFDLSHRRHNLQQSGNRHK